VRRELRLRAEGGETTDGGGLEAVPTFVTVDDLFLSSVAH
jgi:hypothetical protein